MQSARVEQSTSRAEGDKRWRVEYWQGLTKANSLYLNCHQTSLLLKYVGFTRFAKSRLRSSNVEPYLISFGILALGKRFTIGCNAKIQESKALIHYIRVKSVSATRRGVFTDSNGADSM